MRRGILALSVTAVLAVGVSGGSGLTEAQSAQSSAAAPRSTPLAAPSNKLEDALLEWPLPPGEQSATAGSTASSCTSYVEEQAAISRRYRDQGHPKFWGRIIGTLRRCGKRRVARGQVQVLRAD